jgi:radical SAM superfamily enzyme YgiQ (UPF0313 family)
MSTIVLSTLNARYSHSALGLRYLFANLGELQHCARIEEFTIHQRPADIVERLLAFNPAIIGLGVYIWNVREISEIAALLKQVAPHIILVAGGPELTAEWDKQALFKWVDHLIIGQADLAFAQLCRDLNAGKTPAKIQHAAPPRLDLLALPYRYYSVTDIAQRVIYVEASRGCPFKCEFCLSALDKSVYAFDLDKFLAEMEDLWQRGARRFKFIDRTFNLKVAHSERILNFFLERLDADTFLHFELVPDYLPTSLKQLITRFPPQALQFEVGVQSLAATVQAQIKRRQDNVKALENLAFLRDHCHLHVDLIAGLPGEDLASFSAGFDQLVAIRPQEIQLGILKRLPGAPLARHDELMRYSPYPPYSVLCSDGMDFNTLQSLGRFARYWDLIANSGRFPHTLPLLLGEQPFARFLAFSDWLYQHSGQTHEIALDRLFEWLYQGLCELWRLPPAQVQTVLLADFQRSGSKKRLSFSPVLPKSARPGARPPRQARHYLPEK